MRTLTWRVTESGGYETSWITLDATTLTAHGRIFGALPDPYWIAYELETDENWTTRRMTVTSDTETSTHHLDLRRDASTHTWTANGTALPWATEALDCDLGLSPLTNTMPVLRHDLHRAPGTHDFLMAWIRVPDLTVVPSLQTYTHLSSNRVRYTSNTFRSDLTYDEAGLVVTYPGMAHRLTDDATDLRER
ncbi:putative glycolipid-binding domain-containing protein [Streptomyces beijiangensis]|uniref:Glycolipid-binding domain-containing protein n=1 Tax=Streptomyces beijiangensis TaxID=163361 RepID=A0A939F2R4_9ACTN|nr:putative glycolipid-binding domain-containing protein [Streptomyces beijiangensis]MBO0510793.1 putative glycolipid-binding domain-containing protein [Streptomyces beijiangensis]